MKKRILIISIFILGIFPKTVFALTTGNEKQINPNATWNQSYSSINCSTKEDLCLIVWRDKRNDPGNENDGPDHGGYYGANSNADIYGQMISSDALLGTDFIIATDLPSATIKIDQANPEVIYNSTRDEFLVAWHEADPLAIDKTSNDNFCRQGGYDIYAQRVSPSKQLIGSKITVSKEADCQWKPIIGYDSFRDNYLITWHDFRYRNPVGADPNPEGKEMFAQFISGDGNLLGTNFLLTKDVSDQSKKALKYQEYASIAYNSDDKEFVAVWMDDRETVGSAFLQDVWGQRLHWENGQVVFTGANFPIFKAPGKSESPEIAYDEFNKEYLVVWTEIVSETERIPKAIKLSRTGSVIGSAFDINSGIQHPAYPDTAVSSLNGDRMITYERSSTLGKLFSFSGQELGSFSSTPWAYIRPTVVFNKITNEFIVLYTGTSGGFERLYYKRLILGTAPTATITPPNATPTIPVCSCPTTVLAKSLGNANCDTFIDGVDFEIWRQEHLGLRPKGNANFNCDTTNTIDNADYQLWRRNRFIKILMQKFAKDENVNINSVSVSTLEPKTWNNSCLECF